MSAERFSLDANILIYALDRGAGNKHHRAVAVIGYAKDRDCTLTIQALGEFYVAVTRKGIVAKADAADQVRDWMGLFPMTAANARALDGAVTAAAEGRLGFWDAVLLTTAGEAGCSIVLSEDMQDGATFGGVTVRNPFAGPSLPTDVRRLLGLE